VAKGFFEKSKLPHSELREIWQLADITRDGSLDLNEFKMAMHLVVLRRHGLPIPSHFYNCQQGFPLIQLNSTSAPVFKIPGRVSSSKSATPKAPKNNGNVTGAAAVTQNSPLVTSTPKSDVKAQGLQQKRPSKGNSKKDICGRRLFDNIYFSVRFCILRVNL
jgi:hypothetical protein